MASKLLPDNPLTKRAQKWKKDQGIISLTLEEMKKKIKDKEFIAEQKVDGQSAIMEYADGKAKFGSLGGRIITDIPVLTEIEVILKKQDVKHALMVGELAGVENGKIIYFDKTESLIKNPAGEKDALHWFPYQLLEINGEKYGEEFETYKKSWPQIVKLFAGAKHIKPVKYNIDSLDAAWKQYVEKEDNEGLVVRTSGNKVYKAKPEYTFDLVIVAVGDKKGKNWPKKMIGTTLMAFMDQDKIFRVAGEIGSGYTDAEAKELFSWAQKNKVGEDNTHVWVKPERVVELQWERSNVRNSKAYKYEHGEYVKVDDRLVGTIVKPRFLRYRTDKAVNPKDLRLEQIPDWNQKNKELSKKARRIASRFLWSSHIALHDSMKDLMKVGPSKPLGYLALEWVENLPKIKKFLESRGLKTLVLEDWECRTKSGLLAAWDREALKKVLKKNENILKEEDWPTEPDKFVLYHFKHRAPPYTDLFNVVADAYADYNNSLRKKVIDEKQAVRVASRFLKKLIEAESNYFYHGTDSDFKNFQSEKTKHATKNPTSVWGVFLTKLPEEAARYVKDFHNGKGKIIKVKVQLSNPYLMSIKEHDSFTTPQDLKNPKWEDLENKALAFKKGLQEKGHDGIIIGKGGRYEETVTFDPSKIKVIDSTDFPKSANLKTDLDKIPETKKPSVFLGGLCDDHNVWRKEVKKEFRDKFLFLDPYDPEWDPEENIYDELAGLILADYRVFYRGGKGSQHEQEFLTQTKRDYKTFDDIEELKQYLKDR
jgi:hypothetical protein